MGEKTVNVNKKKGKTGKPKKRVLFVDDEIDIILLAVRILQGKYPDCEIVGVSSIEEATKKIIASLINNEPFNLAIVDLYLPGESGADFARRLIDIVQDINVVIMTGAPNSLELLDIAPDAVIIKSGNIYDTLIETTGRLMKPRRISTDSKIVRANWFRATQYFSGRLSEAYIKKFKLRSEDEKYFSGVSALRPFTQKIDIVEPGKEVEQIITKTKQGDWIATVIYYNKEVAPKKVNVVISSLIGCPIDCGFCINPHIRKDGNGEPIKYKGKLSVDEIIAQVYHAMMSQRVKEAMAERSDIELVINIAGEGEPLLNSNNCFEAIRHLLKIRENKRPKISFIVTTIGIEKELEMFLNEYADLVPYVTFYWSLNFREKMRKEHMPGTTKESVSRLKDLFTRIAKISGIPVTVSWACFEGINRINITKEDAEFLADIIGSEGLLTGKLMAGIEDILKGAKNTSKEAVINFGKLLGVPYRIREIVGTGCDRCGNSAPEWIVEKC